MERHRTDVLSLVFGLLFVAIAAAGLTDQIELGAADVRWIAPGLLVLIGVLLVLPIGRTRSEPEPLERAEPEEEAAEDVGRD